jgi:hypothetical protein
MRTLLYPVCPACRRLCCRGLGLYSIRPLDRPLWRLRQGMLYHPSSAYWKRSAALFG